MLITSTFFWSFISLYSFYSTYLIKSLIPISITCLALWLISLVWVFLSFGKSILLLLQRDSADLKALFKSANGNQHPSAFLSYSIPERSTNVPLHFQKLCSKTDCPKCIKIHVREFMYSTNYCPREKIKFKNFRSRYQTI